MARCRPNCEHRSWRPGPTAEPDPKKQADLWIHYQKCLVDQANHVILFQPIYRIAVRNTLDKLPLTAAGLQIDMYDAKSKGA